MLVSTLLFLAISTWNSLPELLVKCGTVLTFKRHLDRIDLSKFITSQSSTCTACICLCILFFSFLLFFAGELGVSDFKTFPTAQLTSCIFCVCYFIIWFAANKFYFILFYLKKLVTQYSPIRLL